MKLTIGMASYNNYSEVWFTVQALRMYQDLTDTEILIIDNYGDARLRDFCNSWGTGQVRYVRYIEVQGTAAPRNKIFEEALGEWVIVIDSHVLFKPDVIKRFKAWASAHLDSKDLLHGPMLYDDHTNMADSMKDEWAGSMWGVWRMVGVGDEADPYDIPMHGMGMFASRKDSWLRFSDKFKGFGGEEGYIHEKYRQAGRHVLCLPWFKWLHHFHTVGGQCFAPYSPKLADIIHNYKVGFAELGLDPSPIYKTFNLTPKVKQVQIDTTGVCGSKCWFCPVRYLPRPERQVMPQELFESILDSMTEAVGLGSVSADWVLWLSSYNDMLLDPMLEQRLASLRKRGLGFSLLTNGVGLAKHIDLVHEYRDVIRGWAVDLPAGSPEDYATHTLNPPEVFGSIIQAFKDLHAKDPEYYGRVVNITINGAYDDEAARKQLVYPLPLGDTEKQRVELQALLPMYSIQTARPLCDRAGSLSPYAIDNKVSRTSVTGCSNGGDRLTEWLHVNSFGEVYSCCQDYNEEYKFGNLKTSSVTEVVKSRIDMHTVKNSLCTKCVFSTQ